MTVSVKNLKINFKTLEAFKEFREYGAQELSMLEELESNIIEDGADSPFYGIFFADKLVARMSLYKREAKFDQYFDPPQDYLELWKLETLPKYRGKNYGKSLIDYAKSFNMPIKTNPRLNSQPFFEKMGFKPVTYEMERDLGENPLVWFPKGVSEQKHHHEYK